MKKNFFTRFKDAWNVFNNRDPSTELIDMYESGYSSRPDRLMLTHGNNHTIANAVFNKIAMDVSIVDIYHAKTDQNGRFVDVVDSGLANCLNLEANLDQTSRAFIQDLVLTLLDQGTACVVPVDTDVDPNTHERRNISSLRVGQITQWMPTTVKINLYNDRTGQKEEITMRKDAVAIIESPLYSVINDRNSTLNRLVQKLSLLDKVDNKASSGKLDLIIQLPYAIKTEARKKMAAERRKDIEDQLANNAFGIAYLDGTEKITQMNRPVENNLMGQIEYLTNLFYSQLGITAEIMNGTASDATMMNYYSRTIEPFLTCICDEFRRKFITKTGRTQGQTVMWIRNPFKLITVSNLAEIIDKFTRNEILSSNEIRQILGLKPSSDPKADELINSNIKNPNPLPSLPAGQNDLDSERDEIFDETLKALESSVDDIISGINGSSNKPQDPAPKSTDIGVDGERDKLFHDTLKALEGSVDDIISGLKLPEKKGGDSDE